MLEKVDLTKKMDKEEYRKRWRSWRSTGESTEGIEKPRDSGHDCL